MREGVLEEVTSGYRGMQLDIERDEWAVSSDVQQLGEKRESVATGGQWKLLMDGM